MLDLLRSRPLRALQWYLSVAKPVHTSPQVIAEVYWLTKRSGRKFRDPAALDPFWKLARQEFEQLKLEEHSVTLEQTDFSEFLRYGPADSSVLQLALRRRAAVLACDGPLRDRCEEREITVLGYSEIASLSRDSEP